MMKLVLTLTLTLITASSTFSQEKITVEKIWKTYEYYGASLNGFRSMNDGNFFSKITSSETGESVTKHSFEDREGEGEVLIPESVLAKVDMSNYSFNADETKALIMTDQKSIYRRSFSAIYYLYDLRTNDLQPLDEKRQPQTLAEYSPDGKKVSYIYENNLYVRDVMTGDVTQITKDGERNAIINGTTDWVYEEEFAITKGYDWSPDSRYIAFLKFDETDVREFNMTYYNKLYPDLYTFKYPKAGQDNSFVTAHLYKLEDKSEMQLDLGDYEYIPRLQWSGTFNKLILQTLNRHQNVLKYHLVDAHAQTIIPRVFYEEKAKTYIDVDDNLLILKDGQTILRTSEKNGYNHIYSLDFNGETKQITTGKWDVIEFLGIDDANKFIYYSSAECGSINKGIYKIGINGKNKKLISSASGHNNAEFSSGMKYFIKTHSSANNPPVFSLCNNKGEEIQVLENNFDLKETLSEYELAKKEFVNFKSADTSISLNGWMMKPANFNPSKKYPVYVNIYGGPGHNTVTDSWGGMNYMYHQLLAQSGYIVVSVDPRGTMYRGRDFKHSTYLELGKYETEDFIAVAKQLGEIGYVDADRIGIMGWSYGGFMTSLCMTKGADYYKMGIAVAPVTNWRYYDNIYTERFMRTPAENENGYDQNSPINFVDQLKGKYLLIHGSGDDNVHYQNTMEMINAMVRADKQFDLFIYPNKNHGIYGGNTRNHLFKMMFDYTLENL